MTIVKISIPAAVALAGALALGGCYSDGDSPGYTYTTPRTVYVPSYVPTRTVYVPAYATRTVYVPQYVAPRYVPAHYSLRGKRR